MQPITLRNPQTNQEKTFKVPTEFHELTQRQYMGAVAILNQMHDRPEMQWALIPLIMDIPLPDYQVLNSVQRVLLLKELEFLSDPKKYPYKAMINSFSTIQYKSVHVPLKLARILGTNLYGPGDGLSNLSFGEFMSAEQRMDAFEKTPSDISNLNDFCGILFRKTKSSLKKMEDKRIPFHEGLIRSNGKVFEHISSDVKRAIVINYQGGKALFPKLYKNLFPADLQNDDDETEEQPTTKKKKTSQSLVWLETIIAMADRDVVKASEIETRSLHRVLKVLDETILYSKKMKAEADRLRRS